MSLADLPTAPYWARKYAQRFLRQAGLAGEAAENAVLLVSEIVTNALRFSPDVGSGPYTGRMSSTAIELSLRCFRDHLLIEVLDTDPAPACHGR